MAAVLLAGLRRALLGGSVGPVWISGSVGSAAVSQARGLIAALFACALSAVAGTALAQSSRPDIPPRAEPGQIERYLQAPAAPQIPSNGPVFNGDFRVPPDEAGELSLMLGSVAIEGSTVYSDEELAPLYEDRLGRKIALAEVFGIADAITARYRNDGYILSRAILPPQTIEDGAVTIRIVEGYIDEVRIEGEVRGERALLDAYAARIMNSRPLSIGDLERYLLLIDDLPGISSEAVLNPAKDTPGAADLVIVVEEDAKDGFVRLDNRGTKFNGPVQLWLGAGLNSLAGVHERTAAKFVTADRLRRELTYLELGHERQIGTEGNKLHLQFTHTDSEPGHTLRSLEIESASRSFRTGLVSPLIRSRAGNLSLHADFTIRNSETTIFDNRLSRDRIRFVSLGARYDNADGSGGVNMLGLHLDRGLNILGASGRGSADLSREKGRADFTRLRLNASRLQRLGPRWSLLADFRSQLAASKLLASEEFGLGGEGCGRAYDPAQVAGDDGACLLAEVRYGHSPGARALQGYQIYGFYDVGRVWRKDAGALEKKADLSSAGLGVRFNFTEWLSGSLEAAWPLVEKADKNAGQQAMKGASRRGFFTVTARF